MRRKRSLVLVYSALFLGCWFLYLPVHAQKDSVKQKSLLFFPVIARSIETGWSFGSVGSLTFRPNPADTVSRTSNMQVLLLYSTKKQLVTAINGSQYFDKEKYILNEQLSFSSYPDKFWGLGKNAQDADEEPYKFKQYYVYLHLLRKVAPHFFAGVLFEKQKVWDITYQAGGKFDQQQVAGRYDYHVSGLGGSLTWDKRNNAFAPDQGFFYQFSLNHFSKFWGSDYVYTNFVFDLRKYVAVKKNVLAFQLFSFNNTGDVPIRSLASFGGANRMRGYYDGRYKDKNQIVFQAEYRFPLYKRFSAVLFGGTGTVGRNFSDYAVKDLKYSYGGGLRFAVNKKEKLNIRIDYGIGQGKNNGFYLQLGEAF
ncbi:MAG: BamA/TamA family outer membrane protein [Chitinophagaceae bacterium]|nr:BamA/TamA family outer membrane protein [Chitinophagaceae bacterium]MCA6454939.1 BamA/TamA family outer membrane protein [Chitinophagaceae bacterium]MCA6458482.1 BamA/TamA family outer membrane protein [Chitinophagaceae bacterium]MCA6465102.1 BamA/TamA family outer membrane protein [Chitinophagaceae bacterium]